MNVLYMYDLIWRQNFNVRTIPCSVSSSNDIFANVWFGVV